MSSPETSVALITYNGEKYVAEQLESIIAQTRPPDEIVVVDDGSSDATVDIVRECLATAGRSDTVVVNDRRLGARDNAARALGLTTGRIVAPADQDDRWHPTKLQRLCEVLADDRVELAFSDATLIDAAGRPTGRRLWQAVGFDETQRRAWLGGAALDVLLKAPVVTGAAMAAKRRLLQAATPFPAAGWHDMWLALFAVATGAGVEPVPETLLDYRLHSNTVGVRPRGPLARLRQRPSGAAQREEQRRLDRVLLDRHAAELPAHVVTAIEAHVAFLSHRDALPANPLTRAIRVSRAAARGDYRRFSRGWSTMLADGLNIGSGSFDEEPDA